MLAAARMPDNCPALVLNADHRPLSYFPLSLWSWQDTIKAVFLERVNILAEYDRAVHSPSFEMKLPSVVSLKTYVKPARNPAFTRFNVFLRDRFGFTNRDNLWACALYGFIYIFSAWQCGRFAQRQRGPTGLILGFADLTTFMITRAVVSSVLAVPVSVFGYAVLYMVT